MKYKILALSLLAYFGVEAQQINPVPDYVFSNRMSVGRNAVTDTAAYFSIGPRYGATRGFMPPMVVDTLTVTGTKRNGLTIFSVQRNKYMYWDSVRVRWSDFAGSSGAYIFASDTASMLTPYLRKVDTTAMLTNYTIGSGTTNYLTKFTGSRTLGNSGVFESGSSIGIGTTSPLQRLHVFSNSTASRIALTGGASNNQGSAISFYQSNNSSALLNIGDKAAITGGAVDTAVIFRAGVNIPLIFEPNADESFRLNANGTVTAKSLAGTGSRIVVANASGTLSASNALSGYVDGSGTTNYIPKFTASSTIGNSQIFDNGTNVGIGTASPTYKLHISGNTYVNAGTNLDLLVRDNGGVLHMEAVNDAATSNIPFRVYGSPINLMGGAVKVNTLGTFNDAVYKLVVNTGTNRNIGIGSQSGEVSIESFNDALSASAGLRIYGAPTQFFGGDVLINTSTDAGAYALQVAGSIYNTTGAVLAASSGSVGIGTTLTTGKLNFENTTAVVTDGIVFTAANTVGTNHGFSIGINRQARTQIASSIKFLAANYSSNDDAYLTFSTGGNDVERMRINPAGNVGIGTTNPSAKLDVYTTRTSSTNATSIVLSDNVTGTQTNGVYKSIRSISNETASVSEIRFMETDGTNNNTSISFATQNTAGGLTERMRINQIGNVGIGTTSPSVRLHVYGDALSESKISYGDITLNAYRVTSSITDFEANSQLIINTTVNNGIKLGLGITNNYLGAIQAYNTSGSPTVARNLTLNPYGAEVLIGTTTDAGAYALQVAGSIYNTGAVDLAATSGSLRIGTTTTNQIFGTSPILQVAGDAGFATFQRFQNNTFGSVVGFTKSRNTTIGSHTIVQSGDDLGRVGYFGSDGSAFQPAAAIDGAVDGTPGANDMPGRLTFFTSADGTTTLTERMRITSAGNVGIGTTAPTQPLHVNGNILTAAPSGGTAKPFKIGAAATVSPTSPNRTIEIEIDGVTYYLHAKTTNN